MGLRLAVSTLALKTIPWPSALEGLRRLPVAAIELAPSLIWEQPSLAPSSARLELRRTVEGQGLRIAGLQSLMFGRDDLQMFGDASSRRASVDHLKKMIDLCRDLGGSVVGFGSPRNRRRHGLPVDTARAMSVPMFSELADHAGSAGVVFCFEPVPSAFGCDFMTGHADALALVRELSHASFKLLWDAGVAASSGDLVESFRRAGSSIGHVHVNEPLLQPPNPSNGEHRRLAGHLRSIGWDRWVSLEFLGGDDALDVANTAIAAYAV